MPNPTIPEEDLLDAEDASKWMQEILIAHPDHKKRYEAAQRSETCDMKQFHNNPLHIHPLKKILNDCHWRIRQDVYLGLGKTSCILPAVHVSQVLAYFQKRGYKVECNKKQPWKYTIQWFINNKKKEGV